MKYFCRWVSLHPTRHVIEADETFEVRPKIGAERHTDGRVYVLVYSRPSRRLSAGP